MKAMFKVLYARARSRKEEEYYEVGFMFLSKFQEGVGATPISCRLPAGDPVANLKAIGEISEKWMVWEKLSMKEMEILTAEWKRFQAGEPIE